MMCLPHPESSQASECLPLNNSQIPSNLRVDPMVLGALIFSQRVILREAGHTTGR